MNFLERLKKRVQTIGQRDPEKLYPHDILFKYFVLPLIPRVVKPNHITLLRFVLVPLVLWFLFRENYQIGVPLFIFAAFTDALDGSLARLRKQITPWGTFYDPLADKLLITGAILFIVIQHINPYFSVLIIFVECIILAGAYVRRKEGRITSANIFGKTKMFLQVVAVLFLLVAVWAGADLFMNVSVATFSLAIAFAILSLFTYGI